MILLPSFLFNLLVEQKKIRQAQKGANYQSCHVFTNPYTLVMSQSGGFLQSVKRIMYDSMTKIQVEHYSQPGMVPITPEELSVKVLKRRSGYVKGLS
ncbi:hypothetical protein ACSBR2_017378 [Camellia fascicularis]